MSQRYTTPTYYHRSSQPPIQSSPPIRMPSYSRRHVEFDPIVSHSREPRDDEKYVMKVFARHASRCPSCANPYEVHKRGETLCAKGHQRALDVAQYLFNMSGQAYSSVDREGNQRIRVEIPAGCDSVRGLLKAIERGLRLRRHDPAPSYDRTYYIPPRTIQPERGDRSGEPQDLRQSRRETAKPPVSVYSRPLRREKPYYSGRGSLFDQDMRERESRSRSRQSTYYYAVV